jgi:hypothetical protein
MLWSGLSSTGIPPSGYWWAQVSKQSIILGLMYWFWILNAAAHSLPVIFFEWHDFFGF